MGFVRPSSANLRCLLLAGAGALGGCLDVESAAGVCAAPLVEARAPARDRGVVLVTSLPGGTSAIVADCSDDPCAFSERPLRNPRGEMISSGTQLVLTGDGSAAVAIVFENGDAGLWSWDLTEEDATAEDDTPLDLRPDRLVAPLRRGDAVLLRDTEGALWIHRPGRRVLSAAAGPEHRVRAVGDRLVLLERVVDGAHRDLFVLDTAAHLPDPVPIARGVAAPSAAAFGPGDAAVVFTVPGPVDETFVFESADGGFVLRDRVAGALAFVRGEQPIAGLSPFTPDGSGLVLRGPDGGLVLRDLDRLSSCAVWPGHAGHVAAAGITRSGWVFFEHESAAARTLVAVGPATGTRTVLGGNADLHLFAAPAGDGEAPWAVGVRDGRFFGVAAGGPPQVLPYRRVTFLAAAGRLFAVAAAERPAPTDEPGTRELRVHALASPDTGAGPIDAAWTDPTPVPVSHPDGTTAPFAVRLAPSDRVCIAGRFPESSGRRCAEAGSDAFLLGMGPADTRP